MTLYDVIRKLVGHIVPIGESNRDAASLKNLKDFHDPIIAIVQDLKDVADEKNRYENSIKLCGLQAQKTLDIIKEIVE